jgi:hypothetical protein
LVLDYLKAEGATEKVEAEAKISALQTYNYITEESRPRDVLYYLCKLDDRRSEENRKAFYMARDTFRIFLIDLFRLIY